MPRVNGVYQLLPGVYGVPNEPIASAPYNSQLDDLAKDANDPRPVTAGGTGGQTSGEALTNLGFSAFVKGLINKATDVLFREATGTDNATNLTKGTLDPARLPDGMAEKKLTGWVSGRDYTNGYLIVTSIPAAASDGAPFLFEIVGNSYGANTPFDIKVQGYLYGNAIIQYGALSSGTKITEIWLFQSGGFLCCWIPWQQYWQGFTVFASDVGYGGADKPAKNLVTSIQNLGKPAGRTKEVSVPISQAALSNTTANFQGAPAAFLRNYSDTQAFMQWVSASGGANRAYIGFGSGIASQFEIYNYTGELQFYAAGARHMRMTGTSIIAEKAIDVTSSVSRAVNATTSVADYAIVGRSTNAGYGGVLGYAADTGIYGILGFANAYSFYGMGKLYTSGNIQSGSNIFADGGTFYGGSSYTVIGGQAAGYVYLRPQTPQSSAGEFKVSTSGDAYAYNFLYTGNGAAFLSSNGNVYGTVWGGYLSTYLGSLAPSSMAASTADSLGSMVEMTNVSGGVIGVNGVVGGASLRVCVGDQNGQTTGRQPGGSWRNISTDVPNNCSVTFVRCW